VGFFFTHPSQQGDVLPDDSVPRRAVAFFDGQNLFYAAKKAFGYSYPNYDPVALAGAICARKGWALAQVRFYTGIPDPSDGDPRTQFWVAKLAQLGRRKVHTFSRPCRNGQEKGIDVRIALDIVSCVLRKDCEVILLFSQDQDLGEATEEAKEIARRQGRWIEVCSAYPVGTAPRQRGIDRTEWITVDRSLYDSCLDLRDYRQKGS
jgi:uncharacterized LabA/DUF88 family protein